MSFTLVTVKHKFQNLDGTAASGTIVFRLSQRITNGGVTYAEQVPRRASLDGTGRLTVQLPPNNGPGTTPRTSTYLVTFFLNSAQLTGDEVSIVVPYDAATGIVTLGTLLPAQEGATL